MKELPYFKFYVNEWLSGDIELLSFEAQGVFIRLCSYYWSKECMMKLERSKKRFKGFEDAFEELIDEGIIKVKDGYLKINFLDAQLNERESLSKTNSANGKKGGRPKKKPIESEKKPNALVSESELKANKSNIEERREEKKREEYYYSKGNLKLSEEEKEKICQKYDVLILDEYISRVENWKNKHKVKSLYLTVLNWIRKDEKQNQSLNTNQQTHSTDGVQQWRPIRDATF
jgi:hypothetical protein